MERSTETGCVAFADADPLLLFESEDAGQYVSESNAVFIRRRWICERSKNPWLVRRFAQVEV